MNIETDELLTLLSERVRAEMARTEAEQQRALEIGWILRQQELIIATMQEFFAEMSQRIDDLEELIISKDSRIIQLKKQLHQWITNLDKLKLEKARRGGELSLSLENQIRQAEMEIEKITAKLGVLDG